MRADRGGWIALCGIIVVTLAAGTAPADDRPAVAGKTVVARVQGEPITRAELDRQLASVKQRRAAVEVDRAVELAVLDRMINVVLIAQEARRMGLDKLPEIRKMVESNARLTLREELVERIIRDVKADPQEVTRMYQASVREWQISAALFEDEEHAKSMAAELGGARSFTELAGAYLEQGKAAKVEAGVWLSRAAMDPQLATAVSGMAAGDVSPVVSTRSGFVILKVEDVRYPDDAGARARAEQVVLTDRRKEAVAAFDDGLKKKYAKIRKEVLDSIDYERETPGIEAYLKDRRVVADVKGESPVTVGDLTEAIKFQFFHGTAMAAERKKLNAKKQQALDGLLHRKLFRKEALRLGLDKSDVYRSKIREFEASALFEAFLRKVIAPGIRLEAAEVQAYYDEHRMQYTTPEMIRLKSLAFADAKQAEMAAASLRQGADFHWVASRAEGQVDPNANGLVSFDGRPIMTSELPDGVRKAVAGARAGDARLYASPDRRVYVLAVQDLVAAQPQPYEQVRHEIAERALDLKIQKAIQEYTDKLRALSDVRVYMGS